MGNTAALGNQVVFSFGPQLEGEIPVFGSANFQFLRLNIPGNFGVVRELEDDGSVNPTGFAQPKFPGTIRGESAELNLRLTSFHVLDFFFHLLGGLVKTPLPGTAFEYVLTGDPSNNNGKFTLFTSFPGVENRILHSFQISEIEIPITGPTPLVAKMTGSILHEQDYDEAEQTVINGTYSQPGIRGPARYRQLGDIYVEVTSISPLLYKAEITETVPTFPQSLETPFAVDTLEDVPRGVFQSLQGAIELSDDVTVLIGTPNVTGGKNFKRVLGIGNKSVGVLTSIAGEEIAILEVLTDTTLTLAANHVAGAANVDLHLINRDFGFQGENKDPIEIVWQGDASDHAGIVVGDQWKFSIDIADRVPVFSQSDRFSAAHAEFYFRQEGDLDWIRFDALQATIKLMWPVSIEEGTGSRYATESDRLGDLMGSLDPFEATFRERNKKFIEWSKSHEVIEAQVRILGDQISDGSVREGLLFDFPNTSIGSLNRSLSTTERIPITHIVHGTSNAANVSPIKVTFFVKARDFTPPVLI